MDTLVIWFFVAFSAFVILRSLKKLFLEGGSGLGVLTMSFGLVLLSMFVMERLEQETAVKEFVALLSW